MRALLCPASLKGVLGPGPAAAALAEGVRRVEGWQAVECPVADGGEGTGELLRQALGGEWQSLTVTGPLGAAVSAGYVVLADGRVVVESAQAIGLGLINPRERDPLQASSAGLGELLHAVLDGSPREVLVCLGGSATVDGGAGLLTLLDRWPGTVPLEVLCDVRSPLLGPRGAARAFGPQKGATPEAVEELERRLAGIARLQRFAALPGSGAAGGLGAALASLGGRLLEGAEFVLDLIGFDELARGATVAITGEGAADETTFEGKVPGAVVRRCAAVGVDCALFSGQAPTDAVRESARSLNAEIHVLGGGELRASEDLADLGERIALSCR
ncbi:MAG: glycerate kinase [Actinomycetes bacterium]